MNVTVRLFAMFRDRVGEKSVAVDVPKGTTVRETIRTIESTYPELEGDLLAADGEIQPSVTVLRNGRHVGAEEGLDDTLDDDDVLSIMPPVTGGE